MTAAMFLPTCLRRRELLAAALVAALPATGQPSPANPAMLLVEGERRRLALVDAERLERDKDTLEVAGTVGLPARLLGPVAFAGDGRAWISVRDREDGLLVVDERRRAIAGRLPTGGNPAVWPDP
jgi:hypothetical protein